MQVYVMSAGAEQVSGARCDDGGQLVTPVAEVRERRRHNRDAGGGCRCWWGIVRGKFSPNIELRSGHNPVSFLAFGPYTRFQLFRNPLRAISSHLFSVLPPACMPLQSPFCQY